MSEKKKNKTKTPQKDRLSYFLFLIKARIWLPQELPQFRFSPANWLGLPQVADCRYSQEKKKFKSPFLWIPHSDTVKIIFKDVHDPLEYLEAQTWIKRKPSSIHLLRKGTQLLIRNPIYLGPYTQTFKTMKLIEKIIHLDIWTLHKQQVLNSSKNCCNSKYSFVLCTSSSNLSSNNKKIPPFIV